MSITLITIAVAASTITTTASITKTEITDPANNVILVLLLL